MEDAVELRDKLTRAVARFAMAGLFKGFAAFRENSIMMREERQLAGRGLYSSTSQLNLSRF